MQGKTKHKDHCALFGIAAVFAAVAAAGQEVVGLPDMPQWPQWSALAPWLSRVLAGLALVLAVLAAVCRVRARRRAAAHAALMGAETVLVLPGAQDPTLLAAGSPKRSRRNKTSPSPQPPVKPVTLPLEWTPARLQALDTAQFLLLCQRFYGEKGMRCEVAQTESSVALLRLHQADGPALVRCVGSDNQPLTAAVLGELAQIAQEAGISKAFVMSSAGVSEDTRKLAAEKRFMVISGEMLLSMIRRLPPDSQQRLLEVAHGTD